MRLLQLVQQQAGVSRRKARALIEAGQVWVDGVRAEHPFAETDGRVRARAVDGRGVSGGDGVLRAEGAERAEGKLCSFADQHNQHVAANRRERHL